MRLRTLPLVSAVLAGLLLVNTEAAAQGRGRPKTPKTTATGATTTTTSSATTAADSTTPSIATVGTFRQFGAWLDDASAADPGDARTGIGVGYWRMSGVSQFNAPMLDLGYGVTDRFQVGASVPFYHTRFEGSTYRGLDDVYLSAKYTVLDPTLTVSEFGLAVSPVLEVLSEGSPDGRVHVGLPVSVELRRQPVRVYGSAGYFSRGSIFTGGAVEFAMSSGTVLTGAVTQSYSLKQDAVLDTLGVGKQRVDVMTGVAYPVLPSAAAYVSVGRSLTSLEEGGASLFFTAGVSFRFAPAKATP